MNLNYLIKESIIKIFIGDTNYGWIIDGKINYSMPYLTKNIILSIAKKYNYILGMCASRKDMMLSLFEYCNKNNELDDLILYLFSKSQFADKLSDIEINKIDEIYKKILDKIITEINKILYFDGFKIVYSLTKLRIYELKTNIELSTDNYDGITSSYIWGLQDRIKTDFDAGNYDSVITKCRTMLEEVFCFVIEKKGESPSESGDINKLYQQVKTLYNMHQNKTIDKRVNSLLSGIEKIISAIAEMRNKDSDSHGIGSRRIRIKDYHCLLFVNSTITLSDFILSISNN